MVATRVDPLRKAALDEICAETGQRVSDLLSIALDDVIERAWRVRQAAGRIAAAEGPQWEDG